MKRSKWVKTAAVLGVAMALTACGNSGGLGIGNGIFSERADAGRVSEGTLRPLIEAALSEVSK